MWAGTEILKKNNKHVKKMTEKPSLLLHFSCRCVSLSRYFFFKISFLQLPRQKPLETATLSVPPTLKQQVITTTIQKQPNQKPLHAQVQ